MAQPGNEGTKNSSNERENINNSVSTDLLTTLFASPEIHTLKTDDENDFEISRVLVAKYFALGKQEGESFKKLLESKVGYKSMIAASSTSGAAGGVIANFVNPAQIATTAGAGIGGAIGGPLGAVAGYAAGGAIASIPGVQTASHALMGAMSGFLIDSAVYLLNATRTKWVSIKEFRKYMEYDLFAWENQHFRMQSVSIQAAVEVLTHYLKSKVTGKFSSFKLLRVSWQDTESGFYLVNAYVKLLLMLMLSIDKMPSSVLLCILNVIEKELETKKIASSLPSDFKQTFLIFKEKIVKYIENRIYSETIVENIGTTLLTGASAITPVMPWIYCSLLGNDQNIKFYDADDFIKRIENDALNSTSYKFWTDLSIIKVNEIKEAKELRLENLEKKIGKVNSLINELNTLQLKSKKSDEIPNEQNILKVEKKVNKLFEYAHDFLKHNFNKKDKQLEKIILLTHQLVKLEDPKVNSVKYSAKIWDKMFDWWNSQHKIYEKATETNSKLYNGLIKISSEQKILTKEEFKNVVNLCFEIKKEFDRNLSLKKQYSIEYVKGEENKKREFVFARKIDSFCELILYVERVSEFMLKDDNINKFSVYSLFGLWSVYNIILNKYSADIPNEIVRSFQDKNLANNYNSDEHLKRYFLIPYESFSKFLIPGFQREYLNKNANDFFRMYVFYLSNIINLVSEIQFHLEALKFSKLILAMFGEEDTSVFFSLAPLNILKDRVNLLLNIMKDFFDHVKSLQESYDLEKSKSWSNMVGLYDFMFGKNTGFYQNFVERYDEYNSRIVIFKRNIDYSISLLEQKSKTSTNEAKPINEVIARKTDKYFKYSLDIFLKYLKSINSNSSDLNYSEKLELQIMDLEERHDTFTSDKGLMLGVLPTFKLIGDTSAYNNDPIHTFVMKFFNTDKYKIPKRVYETSKQEHVNKMLSSMLQNFLKKGECAEILKECILKVRESSHFQSFGYDFYKRNSLFDITRNEIFFADAPLREALFLQYFSTLEKNTKIQLITHTSDENHQKDNDRNLLKESGLSEINLDFDTNIDENKNYPYLVYLLVFTYAQFPANKESILSEFYSSNSSEKEKKAFVYSVWGLFGLVLAYMFDGTREKYNQISSSYQEEKFKRKAEEAQIAGIKDKNIAAEKKKLLQEKIEFKNQIELERKAYEQTQTTMYTQIVMGVQMEIKRLDNTEKGKLLKAEFEKIDKENSINLINKLSKVLSQHRSYFSFGTPQSYNNILALAQKNGISQSDLAKATVKDSV